MFEKNIDFKSKNFKFIILGVFILILFQGLVSSISYKALFNLPALQIIMAGITISIIISFPMDVLVETLKTIKKSFKDEVDYEKTIVKLYDLSIKVKKDGLLSIKDDIELEEDIFIKDAMILLNDYKKEDVIEDILNHDIESRRIELYKPYNVMKMIANISPAFGLIGTLVGMIGLLEHINQVDQIMTNMASALVSTLYGSLIANFFAFPMMARIKEYNEQKLLEYRMIKEGIILISKGDSTRNVFDKMNVMLREDKRMIYPREYIKEGASQENEFQPQEYPKF